MRGAQAWGSGGSVQGTEAGSDLASLAHRSSGEVYGASTTAGLESALRTQRSRVGMWAVGRAPSQRAYLLEQSCDIEALGLFGRQPSFSASSLAAIQ